MTNSSPVWIWRVDRAVKTCLMCEDARHRSFVQGAEHVGMTSKHGRPVGPVVDADHDVSDLDQDAGPRLVLADLVRGVVRRTVDVDGGARLLVEVGPGMAYCASPGGRSPSDSTRSSPCLSSRLTRRFRSAAKRSAREPAPPAGRHSARENSSPMASYPPRPRERAGVEPFGAGRERHGQRRIAVPMRAAAGHALTCPAGRSPAGSGNPR